LALTRWAVHNRLVQFVLQVPLTVPHLVVAVSMLFLLAPAGLAARLAAALGLIASPGQFPLLVNDRWAVGILLVYIWKEIPFITLMVLSVLQNAGGELSERWFFPGLWPQQWGLRSWQHLLDAAGGQVASGLLQSTALAAATAAVSLAAGVPAGRALGLYAFRGKALLAVLVVLPLIVPPLSVAMAFIWGNCAWSMSAWATARSRWCGTSPFR
jgi:ABC-type spermidine/putrescine transport system permease subunit II